MSRKRPECASGEERTENLVSRKDDSLQIDQNVFTNLKFQGPSDPAYKIGSRAVASIPTAQVFPDGFPKDFSILATFRADPKSKSMLFTAYSSEGHEVLSLKIARRLRVQYQGELGSKDRIKFAPNLADGK